MLTDVCRLGRFSFYQLVPRHSDPYSLLLNSTLMARFAAPLSYNFLHMINVVPDIHIERPQCPKQEDPNTSFSQVMEAMNEVCFRYGARVLSIMSQ